MFGAGQHKIMIVGGPNRRDDYHIEEGEELFYMIKGDMLLKIIERGVRRDVVIKEGEFFLLPARVPHSPNRFENTIGLVVERERLEKETDGLRWYVKGSEELKILYQEWFHCVDLGTQLKPIIERFFASEECKTDTPSEEYSDADNPFPLDTKIACGDPINFRAWAAEHASEGRNALLYGGPDTEYQVAVFSGPDDWAHWKMNDGETFFWQFDGEVELTVRDTEGAVTKHTVGPGDVYMLPNGWHYKAARPHGSLGIVVTNTVFTDDDKKPMA